MPFLVSNAQFNLIIDNLFKDFVVFDLKNYKKWHLPVLIFWFFYACPSYSLSLPNENIHPCVIIGGGVGGLNSSIQFSRFGYPALLVNGMAGGQLVENHFVQNWPGEIGIEGSCLIEKFKQHARYLGVKFIDGQVCSVDFSSKPLTITVDDGSGVKTDLKADSCIISTGVKQNKLAIPGEDEFWGHGVSSCIVCDAQFFKDKSVAVIGTGDSALSKIEFLNLFSNKIYVISRSEKLRGFGWKAQLLNKNPKFEILFSTAVEEILGQNGTVCGLKVKDKYGQIRIIDVSGVFISIGAGPNTDIFQDQLSLDQEGFIKVDINQRTSVPNVFAVGDCCVCQQKQAITAAGQAFIASFQAIKSLALNKVKTEINSTFSSNSSAEKIIKSEFIPGNDKIVEFDEKDLLNMPKQGLFKRDGDPIIEVQSITEINSHIGKAQKPRVLNIYTTWCLACNDLHPVFDDLALEYSGKIAFFSANADRSHDIVFNFEIRGIPTIIFFDKKGNFVESIYGEKISKKTLEDKLNSLLKK